MTDIAALANAAVTYTAQSDETYEPSLQILDDSLCTNEQTGSSAECCPTIPQLALYR